jgi:hypothetical protein
VYIILKIKMSHLKNPTDPLIPTHVRRGFLLKRTDANFVKDKFIPNMKNYESAPETIKNQIENNRVVDALVHSYYVDNEGQCWLSAYNDVHQFWFPIQRLDDDLCKSARRQGGYKMRRRSVRGHKKSSNRSKSRSRR